MEKKDIAAHHVVATARSDTMNTAMGFEQEEPTVLKDSILFI